ncbi:amidinotransferase [Limnothrix redekei]|uniref:Amidinotransferase n=1 Tax=Limnothrix redekei LRLZ20PSL1 TaxID=3112953 RepID=A0ABW7CDA5_9CYAN
MGSSTEWDLLKEVIVGRLEGSMFPSWDKILMKTIPRDALSAYELQFAQKGKHIPEHIIEKGNIALDNLVSLLKAEGVKVQRPEIFDFSQSFATPLWMVESGVSSANPRDVFMVIDNNIIECPMADRGRYFEAFPYRKILKNLSDNGWKWASAPKPMLSDDFYTSSDHNFPYSITEAEPTFDGADFMRFGENIIGQLSHVTNYSGVKWLQSFLGDQYKIHLIQSKCPEALHIDTTLIPLCNNKVLINPEFIDSSCLPEFLSTWKLIEAPKPDSFMTEIGEYRIVSDWMSVNILSIDEKRVIVEKKQQSLISLLKSEGFEPIPCAFEDYYIFGGSFHCATLDICRQSYNL